MTYDRMDLRLTQKGSIIAVLFGVTVEGQSLTVEACFIPEPIKRSIRVRFETFQIQIPKATPDLYGPVFGTACPQFEVINNG